MAGKSPEPLTGILTVFWSCRVGVNRFSLHSLYADRLIRAYLGASNLKRNAELFTGFDDKDNDIHLPDLAKNHSGPYLIINAAINLVSSQRLAWQKRKTASFTFTSQYCGYEFSGEKYDENENKNNLKRAVRRGGFVESIGYAGERGKGLSLGKAMTISGAAASPNMGYHSSPALTFLMTTFNVRLGWWLPNTARKQPKRKEPKRKESERKKESKRLAEREPFMGLLYLIKELMGNTDASSKYVYLSDGGHFENLGIYELVRRRCRHIIACDSEADPNMTFSGLGNAIEKCRTDLGVPIEIDISQIKPDPASGHSQWHCAVGYIRYSEAVQDQPDGTLLYLKASLTGDEPLDVTTYANDHSCFPHESTADQWFDENQFESYRMLGEHIVQKVLETAVNEVDSVKDLNERKIERVIREVRKQWYPGSSVHVNKLSDHDVLLESILDTLRTEPHLSYLDGQLYPNLKIVEDAYLHGSLLSTHHDSKPESYEEFRAGFYFCKRLIQFMQQVYYDRQLDLEYGAPKNRGWMNLFRRWSCSRMLKYTWAMTSGTYGARFRSFCEHHLSLHVGEPKFSDKPIEIEATREEAFKWENVKNHFGLHYYEKSLISKFIEAYTESENPSEPCKFEVFILKLATDDAREDQAFIDMDINVGFLIAGPGPAKEKPECKTGNSKNAILYFRIRPSMRNMDLCRKAFTKFRKHTALKNYGICLVDDFPLTKDMSETTWQREAYREIHHLEREHINHCRWLSQSLPKVEKDEKKDKDKQKDI